MLSLPSLFTDGQSSISPAESHAPESASLIDIPVPGHEMTGAEPEFAGQPARVPSGRQRVLYVPLGSQDIYDMIRGANQTRLRAGKSPCPVIAKDDCTRDQLEKFRRDDVRGHEATQQRFEEALVKSQEMRNQIAKITASNATSHRALAELNEESLKADEGSREIVAHEHWQIDALNRIEIRSAESGHELSSLDPKLHKLYIHGHGSAGEDRLTSDRHAIGPKITAEQLASDLAQAGLPPDFSDIRLLSCFSADARPLTSFEASEREMASRGLPHTDAQTPPAKSFAQSFANELRKRGFKRPCVTGYHGLGQIFSSSHHQQRAWEDRGGRQARVRASLVRQTFVPEEETAAPQRNPTDNQGTAATAITPINSASM